MALSNKDSGKEVYLKRGQTIHVELPGNITTGYQWYVEMVDVEILEVEGIYEAKQPVIPGSGGVQKYVLKGIGEGTTKLQCHYKRHWERKEPLQIFELTVKVML